MTRVSALVALGLAFAGAELAQESPPPQRTEILERAERSLAQLDVTVEGPADVIGDLTRDDFVLIVGGRAVEKFEVDRECVDPGVGDDRQRRRHEPIVPPERASYLFYFDQHHLTLGGRLASIDLARSLIERLVQRESRAAIVSAGRRLTTFAELSCHVGVL